ncbi:hypothetical protein K488DRAFT_82026 [Vararia minispora EC-137]|uniref:Uncharacterized protein n=1 Tax=Vararia minispora EC-137 TaxID=1314806 RepID=A0ACB8QXZ1_9AGAM|nr:hypothetical protein K488DRAFT_82026 [Vararia minispora EC-137]
MALHQPPVYRMPAELLMETFEWLGASYYEDALSDDFLKFSIRIAVSQVCRFWRTIALACPALWTDIPTHHAELADISLQRSRTWPIALYAHFDAPPAGRTRSRMDVVLACLQRVGSVSVLRVESENMQDMLRIIDPALLSSAPRLEELALDGVNIPSNIFSGETPPQLKILDLFNCTLSSSSCLLGPSLTELKLHLASSPWRSVDEILTLLRRMPSLEEVCFEGNALDFSFTFESPPEYRVLLTELFYLCLEGEFQILEALVLCIAGPIHSKLGLKITSTEPDFAWDDEGPGLVKGRFQSEHKEFLSFRHVSLTDSAEFGQRTVQLHCSGARPLRRGIDVPGYISLPDVFELELCVPTGDWPEPPYLGTIANICSALPLGNVENITLKGRSAVTETEHYLDILYSIGTRAKALHVNSDVKLFSLLSCQTLSTCPLPASSRYHLPPCLPQLRHLTLTGGEYLTSPRDDDWQRTTFGSLVRAYAGTQAPANRDKRHLTLAKCKISLEAWEMLQEKLGEDFVAEEDCEIRA